MTTWYVTTGISLWESSRCWRLEGVSDDVLQEAARLSENELLTEQAGPALLEQWKAARESIKTTLSSTNAGEKQRVARGLVNHHFSPRSWSRDFLKALPAELSTLWALFDRGQILRNDTVAFIAGESNVDVAYVLQAMLERALNRAFSIGIIGPFRLDPTDENTFNQEIQRMWNEVRDTNPKAFVLTGGYKAVVMAIARQSPPGTPLYYSHESDPSRPIQLTARENGVMTVVQYMPW